MSDEAATVAPVAGTRGAASPAPAAMRAPVNAAAVLGLQRSAGNRAVSRLLSRAAGPGAVGGLDPEAPEPEEIDETTDALGGVGATRAGSVAYDWAASTGPGRVQVARQGGSGTTQAPPRPSITVHKVTDPTWSPHGAFDWRVGFATTGRNGWIVQEIVNSISVTDSTGAAVDTSGVVPHYWEAWAVDGSGTITPSLGKVHDMWIRPSRGAGTKGTWSMSGRLHFTTTDPATQGFTPGGVSNAGILLSTTTKPSGLGPILRWRVASGSWDDNSTPAKAHTGHWG